MNERPKQVAAPLTPDQLRDEHLGFWSSHPRHKARNATVFQVLALIPLALFALIILFYLLNYRNVIPLLKNLPQWLVGLGLALAASLNALLAMALASRWSALQVQGKISGGSGAERVNQRAFAIVFTAGIMLSAAGPIISHYLTGRTVPQWIVFCLHLLPVLPVFALVIGMHMLGGGSVNEKGKTVEHRPIWLLLCLVVLGLMVMTVAYDLAATLNHSGITQALGRWMPWYVHLQKKFVGLVSLGPLAYVLLMVWQLWTRTVPVKPEEPSAPAESEKSEEKESAWSRVCAWFTKLFGKKTEPAEEEKADDTPHPPEWLASLLAELPEGCTCEHGAELVVAGDTSGFSEDESIRMLFGTLQPTEDQAAFLKRFIRSYSEVLDDPNSGEVGQEAAPSADLIVQGDPGNGKTTALIAAALYAAFVRGQRVLFLVSNLERAQAIKACTDEFLKSVQLHFYVRTELITEKTVSDWVSESGIIPHIFISTPNLLEKHLYEAPYKSGAQFERLRRIVHLMEVVIVDEFMDFEDSERSHIPFILDKQRLLMAAEFIPIQVVVSCPRLAQIGEAIFGSRLFTEKRLKTDTNVLLIRPRPCGRAWRVDVSAREVPAALESMSVWCLRHELSVVIYRKGIDEVERERQRTQIVRKGNSEQISIISDLGQPIHQLPDDIDAIFYQVAVHEDTCMALRLHLGGEDTVIFSLSLAGEERESLDTGIVPIVADRSATSLMVSHLRSIQRFLPPQTPIPADTWLQFGLRYDYLPGAVPKKTPDMVMEYDAYEGEEYGREIWPYLTSGVQHGAFESLNMFALSADERRFYKVENAQRMAVFLGAPDETDGAAPRPEVATRARWLSSAGQHMRDADLIHLREAKLTYDRQVFVPGSIKTRNKEIEFVAKNWRGTGDDAYLPLFAVNWEVKRAQEVDLLGGSPDYAVRWFNATAQEEGSIVEVATVFKALLTEYGAVNDIPSVEFRYSARLSGVLLIPAYMDSDIVSSEIAETLKGRWSTGANTGFWPELTGAMSYALEARVPGLSFFGRPMAFTLSGKSEETPGEALLWFVEPASSGRTVMRVLSELLADTKERKALFSSAAWFLAQMSKISGPPEDRTQFMRRYARIGYTGDENVSRLKEAAELVRKVIYAADVRLGLVKRPPAPPTNPYGGRRPPKKIDAPIEWDDTGKAIPWKTCVEMLWATARGQVPEIDSSVLADGKNSVRFRIECKQPMAWPADVKFIAGDLQVVTTETMLSVAPSATAIGLHFAGQVAAYLEAIMPKLALKAGTSLSIRLWILPRAELSDERIPQIHDPLNTLLVGGFKLDGLLLAPISKPIEWKRPLPEEGPRLPEEYHMPPNPPPAQGGWEADPLPDPAELGVELGDREFKWMFRGREYGLRWGFKDAAATSAYLGFLNGMRERISNESYFGYIQNDPYAKAIHQLAESLLQLYNAPMDAGFAEFLLSFVQALPYEEDPVGPTDFPRFPSEYLLNAGGDCEDSSIAYLSLLAHFGIDAAFLSMKGHLAVGVCGPYQGSHYEVNGKKYFYAETATNASYLPLGSSSEIASSARIVSAGNKTLVVDAPVSILAVQSISGANSKLRCVLTSCMSEPKPVSLSVVLRATNDVYFMDCASMAVGSVQLPAHNQGLWRATVEIPADWSRAPRGGTVVLDVLAWSENRQMGSWIGAVKMMLT